MNLYNLEGPKSQTGANKNPPIPHVNNDIEIVVVTLQTWLLRK